jgi:hypothetical protein
MAMTFSHLFKLLYNATNLYFVQLNLNTPILKDRTSRYFNREWIQQVSLMMT